MPLYPAGLRDFYPRPPRGGRHLTGDDTAVLVQFLSTPSARRATGRSLDVHRRSVISIHALREEGDLSADTLWQQRGNFYPRPPRGGRRKRTLQEVAQYIFLSTPSARRATRLHRKQKRRILISIHALREEGDLLLFHAEPHPVISIHALREEGDKLRFVVHCESPLFLSTPSARRATGRPGCGHQVWRISIHALREEGDICDQKAVRQRKNFYPRPPRGGRRG